jgi:nitrite reductase/ring-hydroxylating ferredoxin subunit
LEELAPGSILAVNAGGYDILLARIGSGDYYALDNLCSHADAWLDMGFLVPATCEVQCPLHEGRFDLRTGKPTALPCIDPIPSYPVTVRDAIYVEVPD